jgi:ATP/maltotriose-dependent transcriptional regulator MalT
VQAQTHAAAALDQLDRDNVLMRGWACASLGFASVGQGDLARAAEAFGEAAASGRTAGNAHAAIMATLNQTYVQRAQGALHLAVATCRQALAWSAAQGAAPSPITGVLHLSLADLLREWNDLDEAQRHLTDGIALCAPWGHVDLQLFGPLFWARLLAARGDLDGALAVLHGAKGDAQHQEPLPLSTALLEACEAQLWLAQGNLPAAAAWAQRAEQEAAAPGPELNPLIVVYTVRHEVAPNEWCRKHPGQCPGRFPIPAGVAGNGGVRSQG